MPPLRKREPKAADMIEINMRATPSSDNIEMPSVTHSVYGQYRPVSRNLNHSRPYTGDYSNISSSTLNVDSPQTLYTPQTMSNAHLPPFAPSTDHRHTSHPLPQQEARPHILVLTVPL